MGKKRLLVIPVEADTPEIGANLWRMQDTRQRLLKWLDEIDTDLLDARPHGMNSVGSVLYHIAAIEIDWLYTDVLGQKFSAKIKELLPQNVRDEKGRLTHIGSQTLEQHKDRLGETRQHLMRVYEVMHLEEFRKVNKHGDNNVSPEWVLHHLLHHEAMHFGEMQTVYSVAAASGSS